MLVCSQCHHQNPDDFDQCEACCAELDAQSSCPNCGCPYLPETKFCGQCGMSLQALSLNDSHFSSEIKLSDLPELSPPDPVIDLHLSWFARRQGGNDFEDIHISQPASVPPPEYRASSEQIQIEGSNLLKGVLVHCETQFKIDLAADASPIHLGKPNPQRMPDINLASFHHSEVVSRIHADILCDNRKFLIQDSGSANGTYVNGQKLKPGNPHTLAPGDKISLGKGDLVTFTFELF